MLQKLTVSYQHHCKVEMFYRAVDSIYCIIKAIEREGINELVKRPHLPFAFTFS